MTVNLILAGVKEETTAAERWEQICAISQEGLVFIDNDLVDRIAKFLERNGKVASYSGDEFMPSFVPSFGPQKLSKKALQGLRSLISEDNKALYLFDEIIRLGVQISFSGPEDCPSHMKAVNWNGDLVEINRTQGNMIQMLEDMGLGETECGQEIPFSEFEKAFRDLGHCSQHFWSQLEDFVNAGKKLGATHVYWA